MLYGITGGRADGTDWPPARGLLTCDDAEAASLVGGRLAEYADSGLVATVVPEPAVSRGKPIVNSPKADWVDYAVSLGADRAAAEAMKKTDLIAAYGGGA